MKNIDFSCLEFGNFTTVWEFYILLSCEERPVDVTQTSHNSSIKPCQGNIWWWQLAKGREDIAMHWRGLKRCLRFRVLKCWGGLYWRTGRCLRYFYFVIVEVDYIDWVGVGDARSWPTDISSYPSILEYSRLPYILNILKQQNSQAGNTFKYPRPRIVPMCKHFWKLAHYSRISYQQLQGPVSIFWWDLRAEKSISPVIHILN